PQKAKAFMPSAKRLLGRLAPERARVMLVLVFAVASVALSVAGPKILGHAANIIFAGFLGARIPGGMAKEQAVAMLRAKGSARFADLISAMDVVPGQGIDFGALQHVLGLVTVLFIGASLFAWLQLYIINHITQRTVRRLRTDVDAKLMRVPLSYFDGQQHGEVLSRASN